VNPYAPGQPADPAVFAGRREILAKSEEAVESARRLTRTTPMLFHGYRGSGKTSILRKVRAEVTSRLSEAVAVDIPLQSETSEDRLYRTIVAEVARQLSTRATVGEKFKAFLRRFSGVNVAGTGVTISPREAGPASQAISIWRDCMDSLDGIPLLMVSIDDAEQLDRSGLGALKTIAEANSPTPVFLVVTGGVEFSDRLATHDSSPVARVFTDSSFDVGELSAAETRDALDNPLRRVDSRSTWSDSGVETVFRLSHGYPYLVHCIARATYRENAILDAEAVNTRLGTALESAAGWLNRECARASDNDILAFAKIASSGKGHLRSSEIIEELAIQAPYIGRLVAQGILLKVSYGHYELRKAPVIAYYHVIRRRLIERLVLPRATEGDSIDSR